MFADNETPGTYRSYMSDYGTVKLVPPIPERIADSVVGEEIADYLLELSKMTYFGAGYAVEAITFDYRALNLPLPEVRPGDELAREVRALKIRVEGLAREIRQHHG
jgi:hypothetical protein